MTPAPSMKELLVLSEITRLQMLARRLEGEDIATTIRNEAISDWAMAGALVPSFAPRLYVIEDADYPRARQLLQTWERELDTPAPPDRPCPACGESVPGNFDSCWNCGADFPV